MKKRESGRRTEPGGDWVGAMCSLLRERVPDNNDNNSAAAVWVEC